MWARGINGPGWAELAVGVLNIGISQITSSPWASTSQKSFTVARGYRAEAARGRERSPAPAQRVQLLAEACARFCFAPRHPNRPRAVLNAAFAAARDRRNKEVTAEVSCTAPPPPLQVFSLSGRCFFKFKGAAKYFFSPLNWKWSPLFPCQLY